jgi:hypothetical protein
MHIAFLLAALLLLPAAPRAEGRMGYLTAGPMFHWNFSGYRFSGFSFGFEVAYWNFARNWGDGHVFTGPMPDVDRPGFGLALGCDGDSRSFRLYAEPQIGWVLYGFSLGPVLELPEAGASPRWGIQGSGWANLVGGLDARFRYVDGRHSQALGLYAKLGALVSGDGEPPE